MTAYYVTSTGSSATDIAIRAVTYEIRITSVLVWNVASTGVGLHLYRHEVSTLSGGTAVDVVPLYQGAPAASATAQVGSPPTLSFSGTSRICGSTYMAPGENSSVSGTYVINTFPGSTSQVTPPLTLTVSPGSVFNVGTGSAGFGLSSNSICQIWFEELRLAGSY